MSNSRFQGPDPRPDLVLFDAGGTLVLIDPDRFNAFVTGWNLSAVDPDRLTEAHFQAMSDYAYRLEAGEHLEFRWWIERFFDLAGLVLPADILSAFGGGRGMWNFPIPGAREVVKDLRARGYRVAVISNSDGTVAEALDRAGFGGLFELVIDSVDVGISKPDPAIFEVALEALDVAPGKAWYVGDSHFHDVGGARAAGLAASVLIDPLGLGPAGQLSVKRIAQLRDLLP
ncbi:MAG: HAD family hydrolase [Acidimicrobiia bacterium]|nr:HAD family hydrolase [Acidimicrobiia bacterium]MDH3396836.1 HAD family hydrolase [Acidimicrobiia bacterium]MDH5614952.1 HAD family hydrolase [Acidimicrobiia bacterium]